MEIYWKLIGILAILGIFEECYRVVIINPKKKSKSMFFGAEGAEK